jgi:C4-dicarboxylate-specific signal transduction histidine kinase
MLKLKIGNVKKQTKLMSDTIEDFTGFFHPDKKKTKFMPLHTVKNALKLIDMHTKYITVDIHAEKDIWLYSFENEYLQVLLSILHNAIDNFSARSTEDPKIQIIIEARDKEVSLFIQDNGGGIRHKEINTVFEPYYTTSNSGENSGLGLYMAKILVEDSMHGILKISNRHDGACFEITLEEGRTYA